MKQLEAAAGKAEMGAAAAEQAVVETSAGNAAATDHEVAAVVPSPQEGERGSKEEVAEETEGEDCRFSRFQDLIF